MDKQVTHEFFENIIHAFAMVSSLEKYSFEVFMKGKYGMIILVKHTLHECCASEQTILAFLFLDLSSQAKGTSAMMRNYEV